MTEAIIDSIHQRAFEFVDCDTEKCTEEPVTENTPKHQNRLKYASHFNIQGKGIYKYGICVYCSMCIKMKHSTTSGLKSHLLSKHPEKFEEFFNKTSNSQHSTKKIKLNETVDVTINNQDVEDCYICGRTFKIKKSSGTSELRKHMIMAHQENFYDENQSNDESNNEDNESIKIEEQSLDMLEETEKYIPNDISVIKSEPIDVVVKTEVLIEDTDSQSFDQIPVKTEPQIDHLDIVDIENVRYGKNDCSSYDLYYIIIPLDEGKKAICRFCSRDIRMKNNNTTGLKRHLQAKHPQQYDNFCQQSHHRKSVANDLNAAKKDVKTEAITLNKNCLSLPSTSVDPQLLQHRTDDEMQSTLTKTIYNLHYMIMTSSDHTRCGICRLCSKCIKMTAGNTSGLKRHLQSKHPRQYIETFCKTETKDAPSEVDQEYKQEYQSVKEADTSRTENISVEEQHLVDSEIHYETNTTNNQNEATVLKYIQKYGCYFNLSNIDRNKVVECRLCIESFSTNNDIKSVLDNHLSMKHPQQYRELYPNKENTDEQMGDCFSSTYVVSIYSDCSESEDENDKESVTYSLRVQKRYTCYYTMSDAKGEKFGICRFCTQMIKMKKSNTSGLRRHLKAWHPQEYIKFASVKTKQK